MPRKLLFVVFTDEPCKLNHAFMQALDLEARGHQVRLLLEGAGTRCLAEREGRFGELFAAARERGLLAGACRTAAGGCSTGDPARDVVSAAAEQGVPLLDDMDGHASLGPYVAEGFEIVVF